MLRLQARGRRTDSASNLFGDVLDHHGFQLVHPDVEEPCLSADNHLAHLDDNVLTLLNVLQELDRGLETILDRLPIM